MITFRLLILIPTPRI